VHVGAAGVLLSSWFVHGVAASLEGGNASRFEERGNAREKGGGAAAELGAAEALAARAAAEDCGPEAALRGWHAAGDGGEREEEADAAVWRGEAGHGPRYGILVGAAVAPNAEQ